MLRWLPYTKFVSPAGSCRFPGALKGATFLYVRVLLLCGRNLKDPWRPFYGSTVREQDKHFDGNLITRTNVPACTVAARAQSVYLIFPPLVEYNLFIKKPLM